MQELLSENLKQADNLRLGQLENGLKYVMLPNKVPPQRFEAHLEMHAGTHAFIVISHQSCINEHMPLSPRRLPPNIASLR